MEVRNITVKPFLSSFPRSGHLPQSGSWFSYADLADIVGSTGGVANCSPFDMDKSELLAPGHPLIPRHLDKRGFTVCVYIIIHACID